MTILIESGVLYFLFYVSRYTIFHTGMPLTQEQLWAVIDDAGNVHELEQSTHELAFALDVWTYMLSHILVCVFSLACIGGLILVV